MLGKPKLYDFFGRVSKRLNCYSKDRKVETPLDARLGRGTQPCHEALCELQVDLQVNIQSM